jgi:hypothetical protein
MNMQRDEGKEIRVGVVLDTLRTRREREPVFALVFTRRV